MTTRRRGPPIAICAFFVLSFSSEAAAHLGHEVQTAERYLKVDVADDHARVVVSLMLGPVEAARVLRIADRDGGDGDGTLTEAEAAAYMRAWGEGLETELGVEVDGEAVSSTWGEPYIDPTGPIAPRPATIEMVARIPLGRGSHRITLRDRMQRETYDRTDVAFRVREGAVLVASGPEEAPEERVSALAFAGSRGPEVFTAVVEVPGSSASGAQDGDGAQPWPWWGAGIAVLLASVLGFAVMRRRRF